MLTLHVEGLVGSSPEQCAEEIVAFAKKLGVTVSMKFNDTPMWAYEDSTVEEVLKQFRLMCK